MCGRFVDPNLRSLGLDMTQTKIQLIPRRYNVKPTQDVYVMLDQQLIMARWGLIPGWFRKELKEWKAATFNARLEDVEHKASFKGPWVHGRCLIPTSGYYEWTGEKSPKQPHFFQSAGNEQTLWFAGLVALWNDMLTCTIMTRAANQSVEPIHDRMPVILNTEEQEAWIRGSIDKDIGAGAQVKHHPVRPFGIKDDGPEMIDPIA